MVTLQQFQLLRVSVIKLALYAFFSSSWIVVKRVPTLKRSVVKKSLVGCWVFVTGCPVSLLIMAKRLYVGSVLFGIIDLELVVEELLVVLALLEDGDGETMKCASDNKFKQYNGSSDASIGNGGTIVGLSGGFWLCFWRPGDAISAQVDSADI